jgi:hypothetical protein
MGPPYYAAALVHGLRGDRSRYEAWREHARAVSVSQSASGFATYSDLRVALHAGDFEQIRAVSARRPDSEYAAFVPYTAAVVAEAAALAQTDDREERLAEAETFAAENDFVAAQVARAAGLLRRDRGALLRSVAMWEAIGARFERACTLVWLADRESEGRHELAALGCLPPAGARIV